MNTRFALLASAALICASGTAHAQDFTLNPTAGNVSLSSGFSPDPYNVPIVSGGSVDASRVGCVGMVANAPDFRLNYSAGSTYPLILSVTSSSDTTLVVNMPDGRWACDDDSAGNLDPMLQFNSPKSCQYDIWVGSFGGGNSPSTLHISEISAGGSSVSSGGGFSGGSSAGGPDLGMPPTYGSVSLNAGFSPDPYEINLTTGGTVDASTVGCYGSIARAPDFRLYYQAGNVFPLIISANSSDDTTLVINQPNGSWVCDDDSGNGSNASVTISSPMSGQYDIYVGSYFGNSEPSTLRISEVSSY